MKPTLFMLALNAIAFVFSPLANAGAPRTFVSISGVDNPSCSAGAPCRTFAAAIAATNPGGEVVVLTSGGYGPVTITTAVSIISPPGIYAGIAAPSGDAITINAGGGDVVVLRGLTINSTGATNGIHVQSAWRVNIEGVQISNFWGGGSGAGILVDDSAAPNIVSIRNVAIRNGGDGVRILADTHYHQVDVDGLVVTDGNNGLVAQGNFNGTVRNGSFAYLSNNAIKVTTSAGMQNPAIALERSRIQNIGTAAVFAQNAFANSGFKLVLTDSVSAFSPYHIQLVESGTGFTQVDVVRTTLEAFGQRAIDASVTGSGVTNVTVVDSLISSGADRGISVDVTGAGYGALVVKNTAIRNVQNGTTGKAIYMHSSSGFASADLQNNLLTHNDSGVVADSHSVVRLAGNTIVNSGPGAGLVVQGTGAMESINNNMVRGSGAVDATPALVGTK